MGALNHPGNIFPVSFIIQMTVAVEYFHSQTYINEPLNDQDFTLISTPVSGNIIRFGWKSAGVKAHQCFIRCVCDRGQSSRLKSKQSLVDDYAGEITAGRFSMFKIVKREEMSDGTVVLNDIDAPMIARKAKPGQFVILKDQQILGSGADDAGHMVADLF